MIISLLSEASICQLQCHDMETPSKGTVTYFFCLFKDHSALEDSSLEHNTSGSQQYFLFIEKMKFMAFFTLCLAFDLASALEPIFSIMEDADTSEIGNCLGDRINSCQKVNTLYNVYKYPFFQTMLVQFKVLIYPSNLFRPIFLLSFRYWAQISTFNPFWVQIPTFLPPKGGLTYSNLRSMWISMPARAGS